LESKVPCCYIHIGTHKTATSSVQAFLRNNRKLLAEKDVVVPRYQDITHTEHILALSAAGRKLETVFPTLSGVSGDSVIRFFLKKILAKSKGKDIVISSEYFYSQDVTTMKRRFFDPILRRGTHDLKFICYVRPQYRFLDSCYVQHLKLGLTERFSEYINQPMPEICYNEWLSQWLDAYGKSIVIRPFEKEQFYKNNIIDDFCHAINLEDTLVDVFERPGMDFNKRLSIEAFYVMQKVWDAAKVLNLKPRIHNIAWIFEKIDLNLSSGNYFSGLTNSIAREIFDKFHDENTLLAKRVLNRDYLFLEDKGDFSFEPCQINPNELTNDQIMQFLTISNYILQTYFVEA
jgi:hypothetical protein